MTKIQRTVVAHYCTFTLSVGAVIESKPKLNRNHRHPTPAFHNGMWVRMGGKHTSQVAFHSALKGSLGTHPKFSDTADAHSFACDTVVSMTRDRQETAVENHRHGTVFSV